jgi:hypothetical protein
VLGFVHLDAELSIKHESWTKQNRTKYYTMGKDSSKKASDSTDTSKKTSDSLVITSQNDAINVKTQTTRESITVKWFKGDFQHESLLLIQAQLSCNSDSMHSLGSKMY